MDSDEEDFVFYGTPIEREEEITSRKKKAVAEASGQLRTAVPWKQEVRDEEGRRRFHGAFTGGFSAGYYNTVGSKEGWTPQSFTSSRKSRAEFKQQSVQDFLDEDEKDELEGRSLETSMQFDTFGFTAAELARKQAEKEQEKRPSAIPGPVPDEVLVPASESIGIKLLLKMGWRRGRSIKESSANSLYDLRREARKAFLALSAGDTAGKSASSELVDNDVEDVTDPSADDGTVFSRSTPVYVLNPKQDSHGLGYDPFKHAPEFRERKRSRMLGTKETLHRKPFPVGDSLFGFKSGRVAPGFGIGALEDYDAEDEDVYASGYDFEESYVEETEEPSKPMNENIKLLRNKEDGLLPGFKAASNSDYQLERFGPPVIPKDFVPHHKFTAPLDVGNKITEETPPEVPPPDDNNLKLMIDGMATLVARCGKLFEDLSRQKNQSNPLFAFLFGGNGQDYYTRKLWEERQKHNDGKKWQLDGKIFQNVKKMTAENRGKILGEKPLERSLEDTAVTAASTDTVNLQFNLADTFTKPVSFGEDPEVVKPFQDDPAKQARFEQFLKEKYRGGLRSMDVGGSSQMSEAARARERLEFEAAAEAIEKGKQGKEINTPSQLFAGVLPTAGLQFTSGEPEQAKASKEELIKEKRYPRREEFQWRPSPILCKRFDLIDPYMGKPPPAPRPRSKMDTLIFMPDPVVAAKVEENVMLGNDQSSLSKVGSEEKGREIVDEEIKVEVNVENVEKPVDLYKAIFSDDEDDDEDDSNPIQAEDPQKNVEVVNKTLNRLIAGDFLESLGKELGLEVPPDLPYTENRECGTASSKEVIIVDREEKDTAGVGSNRSSVGYAVTGSFMTAEVARASNDKQNTTGSAQTNGSRKTEAGIPEKSGRKDASENVKKEERKTKSPTRRARNWSSGSSEDERSRKRSRHRHRSRNSGSETSDSSDGSRHYSRSEGKKKRSSQEKSSSRRHSKHRKHRHRDSPETQRDSRYGSGKAHGRAKDRRRHRD
ncbi:G patch domain-containing protein TGH [Coffea arabica]|uniref:G patch domain-containing protein TGH n=1 Tax=Coffea arabica TaxID=13443 RepID=A0A6P6XHG1_COFAR